MTIKSHCPQPEPSPAFRAFLAALDKYLDVNTSIPVREACPDDLAWELERALSRWMMAKQAECIRRGKPTQQEWEAAGHWLKERLGIG